MNLRDRSFEYVARYPSGESEVLLHVPRYNFNWQHTYVLAKPKVLPPGTVIECTARFDNSRNSKYNPDPSRVVRWGGQTWDEMMIGFVTVAYDAKLSEDEVLAPEK